MDLEKNQLITTKAKAKKQHYSTRVISEHKLPGGNIVHFLHKQGAREQITSVFIPIEAFITEPKGKKDDQKTTN